ncbi:MAG: DMT family transporter [Pseudomonadota bacterium]
MPSDSTADLSPNVSAATAALVLAAMLWGGNFVVGRAIRGAVDPEVLNLLRWCLAAVAFLPFTWGKLRRHGALLWVHWRWVVGLALTGVVGFQQATYTALTMSPVANAVLLLATTPLMIVATSALLGKGTLSPMRIAAVLLSLLGVAIILGDGDPTAVLRFELTHGDLWLLGSVACWTAYTQLLRAAPAGIPGDVSLMASMLAGLPMLGVLAWVFGDTAVASIPPLAWAGVAYVGLGAALAAFLAWGYGVTRKGPDAAALYLNLIPVFAIGLAWAILGEGVSMGQVLGAGCVVGALVLGTRQSG